MKLKPTLTLAALAVIGMAMSSPAQARNEYIENALKERPELSKFYNALVTTGVINELNAGSSYTILAPTNDALEEITVSEYPCFYSEQCRPEIADILRNHIVPRETPVTDAASRGVSMFSIDNRKIPVAELNKGDFQVDGHKVVETHQMVGSILYEIDGVNADKTELPAFRNLKVQPMAAEVGTKTTVKKEVVNSPDGTPDVVSTTTTITAPASTMDTPANSFPAPAR